VALYERFSEHVNGIAKGDAHEHDARSPVAKDRDRIIHCGAFRRLQRKSQIVGVQSADFFRTRLTHTIECAQIARGIALRSSQTDGLDSVVEDPAHLPDLLEAAALAHDLGHPPFGHNGEEALRGLMSKHARGLFEGNAQSFRIVTNLEPKVEAGDRWCGLDLTRTTLKAILKYPLTEDEALEQGAEKFCIYRDAEDQAVYEWLFDGQEPARTVATNMLEAADDIAYAAHDFEDGVWSGMIPLFRLLDESDQSARELLLERLGKSKRHAAVFEGVDINNVLDQFCRTYALQDQDWARKPFDGSRSSRSKLKKLTAALIGDFIAGVTPKDEFSEMSAELEQRLYLLTGMAWVWMIENPGEETTRFGQRRLIEDIFDGYWANPRMLPSREEWGEADAAGPTLNDRQLSNADNEKPKEKLDVWQRKARLICDHVAGMTDLYALHVHGEMFQGGVGPGIMRLSR
jgi:dGTPase